MQPKSQTLIAHLIHAKTNRQLSLIEDFHLRRYSTIGTAITLKAFINDNLTGIILNTVYSAISISLTCIKPDKRSFIPRIAIISHKILIKNRFPIKIVNLNFIKRNRIHLIIIKTNDT